VAWDQIEYPNRKHQSIVADRSPEVSFKEDDSHFQFEGPRFTAAIGKSSGLIEEYTSQGKAFFLSPLMPNFWRALTDNDGAWTKGRADYKSWAAVKDEMKVTSVEVAGKTSSHVTVVADFDLRAVPSAYQITYTVHGSGRIRLAVKYTHEGDLDSPLRIGLTTTIPTDYDQVQWYGRGLHESYSDRKTGAAIGIWEQSVEDMVFEYIRPQENGNRTETRWFTLSAGEGRSFKATGGTLFDFSVWPYTQEDISPKSGGYNIHDVPRRDFLTLNIDHGSIGVGGITSWGTRARPLPEYLMNQAGETYEYVVDLMLEE
jgi:beta-galactosidase